MANIIEHEVNVKSVNSQTKTITVTLLSVGACAGCAARGACGMSENKEKEWDIQVSDTSEYTVGAKALLKTTVSTGLKAVLWAYVVPFLCLVAVIFATFYISGNELISGLTALAGVVVYFLLLRCFSKKIGKNFQFSLSPLKENFY